MALRIGPIKYTKGDESFEQDEVKIISKKFHDEPNAHRAPNDIVETVKFEAETEHGTIKGKATTRRSEFDTEFIFEEVSELSIDNDDDTIEIECPDCTIEEDEDE